MPMIKNPKLGFNAYWMVCTRILHVYIYNIVSTRRGYTMGTEGLAIYPPEGGARRW